MAEREALALALDSPSVFEDPLGPENALDLADAILAALPDHVLISKDELERLRRIEAGSKAHIASVDERDRASLAWMACKCDEDTRAALRAALEEDR